MGRRALEKGRFAAGYPEIERRLEDWARWVQVYAEALGWAIPDADGKRLGRSNTEHSDPTFWHIWHIERPNGQGREMQTDSMLREMPALWRKLVVWGYIYNYGPNMISERVGMKPESITHNFQGLYLEMSERLHGERRAATDDAERARVWLERIRPIAA